VIRREKKEDLFWNRHDSCRWQVGSRKIPGKKKKKGNGQTGAPRLGKKKKGKRSFCFMIFPQQ